MEMKKKIKIISAASAAVLAGLTFVSPTVYNNNLTQVSPVEVVYGFVPLDWDVTGKLYWTDEVELRATGQWRVDEVMVQDGDTVSEGDLLFTLDIRDNEIQAMSREAELLRLQNSLNELSESAGQSGNTDVKAPFNGVFLMNNTVRTGQSLLKGEVVGRYVNDSVLRVALPFSVGYREQIKTGMTADVSITGWMTSLTGRVESVSKTESYLDGVLVLMVDFLIDNPGALTENDTAYVTITAESGEQILAAGTGHLRCEREELLTAPISGIVTNAVQNNSRHTKGATLIHLQKEAQGDYSRDYNEITAQIAVLGKQIERYEYPSDGNVYAESGGIVSGLTAKHGETIYEGDIFMYLMPDEKPLLKFELPNEKDTPMVFGGQKLPQIQAAVEVLRHDGSYSRVTVSGMVTSGRLRGGQWECVAELDDFDGRPAVGQDVLTRVTYQGEIQSAVVPVDCIFDQGNNKLYVYVIETRNGLFGEESYLSEVSVRVLYQNEELASLSADSLYATMILARRPSVSIQDGDVVWVREW